MVVIGGCSAPTVCTTHKMPRGSGGVTHEGTVAGPMGMVGRRISR